MFVRLMRLKCPPDKYSGFQNRFRIPRACCCDKAVKVVAPRLKKSKVLPLHIEGYDGSSIDTTNLPTRVMRRTRKIDTLHLLDKEVARDFASMITENVQMEESFVAEANPGVGLLSKELLDSGISKLHAYEKNSDFLPYLNSLSEEYLGHFEVRPFNFLAIANIDFLDGKVNTKNMDKIFTGVQMKEWNESPTMTIVGAIPTMQFFYALQWSMVNRYLAKYGRVALCAAILPSMTAAFRDDPDMKFLHKAKNILLRSFFTITKLGTLPREAFFPWAPEKEWRKRFGQYYVQDTETMDVVKFETNRDFFGDDFTRQDAVMFYYFLKMHMKRRNTRIIPSLEKWVPGCGPRLIREDYDIYTTFAELNSTQLLHLFKTFKSWPEYDTCPLIDLVNNILQAKAQQEESS